MQTRSSNPITDMLNKTKYEKILTTCFKSKLNCHQKFHKNLTFGVDFKLQVFLLIKLKHKCRVTLHKGCNDKLLN